MKVAQRILNKIVKQQQELLGLEHWTIKIEIIKNGILTLIHKQQVYADVVMETAKCSAVIRISREWDDQNVLFDFSLQELILHEMLHVYLEANSLKIKGRAEAEEHFCNNLAFLLTR